MRVYLDVIRLSIAVVTAVLDGDPSLFPQLAEKNTSLFDRLVSSRQVDDPFFQQFFTGKTEIVPVYKCQVIEIQLKNRKKTMRNPVQDGTIMM
ncbi:hypothetical protein, partial [Thiolapillus sp.]|uniref:hypothetical protein n=1 Tax=Thiolapillus sp. TaxID=2017437 RepID=UPI003AF5E088